MPTSAPDILPAALVRLPPADRALLELSLQRGLSDEEIAGVAGIGPRDVAARRDALLRRLAGELGPAADEDAVAAGIAHLGRPGSPPADRRDGQQRLERPAWLQRAASAHRAAGLVLLLALPGGLTAYLGFNAGGFFAGSTAAAAVVVAVAFVLRLTLAEHPFAGVGALGAIAVTGLGGLAVWTLLSGSWSESSARALIEFDRVLLYLLVLALFITLPRTRVRMSGMLSGFALAAAVVCLAGLGSRLLPDLVTTAPNVSAERLSYPLTYWNALGLLCALGVIACFHLAASERESTLPRVLAAGVIPGLLVTLLFTFSRGAIAAGALGLLTYVVLARPRGLLTALVATGPAAAVAVGVAYGADQLTGDNPLAASAAGEASRVAIVTGVAMAVAALLRLGLVPVDRRLARVRLAPARRRAVIAVGVPAVIAAALAAALALGLPGEVDRQFDRFVHGEDIQERGDTRQRLTDPGNNGRLEEWRVALKGFEADAVKGAGAGTYENLWARHRDIDFAVYDGHSLYMEMLGELGVVGVLLLSVALLAILVGLAARLRGPDRAIYAAVLALALSWALHAGVDWDWEMPALGVGLFALAGAALARPHSRAPALAPPGRLVRVTGGVAVLLLAVTPGLIYVSQRHLDESARSLERGDCATVVDRALDANSVLSLRPEPLELIAYCDVRLGQPQLAVRAMTRALERDPDNWRLHYGLALVRGAAGLDPRPAARRARQLNPLGDFPEDAVERFRTADPRKWKRRALGARLPLNR